MVAAKAFYLAGTGIDDVEKLTAHWDYTIARSALWRGGVGKPEAKRDGHMAALVYCERYITVSALTWVHGRLQAVTALARCQARVTKPSRETGLASANAVFVV
ncbi:hypothetical protein [uncultured Pseudomonas sp.]|uniref:hypothetical protein n=1 Tax=uncultured Pseudomonas sp. TaxID=114707 RepID=UPI0027DE50E9|nr:hypothetical protein [uncultured Pseudomonas sp.]